MGKKPTVPPSDPKNPPNRKPDEIVPPLEPPKPDATIGDPTQQEPPIKAEDDPESAQTARGQPDSDSDEVF